MGRLFRHLREEKGYTYGIGSGFSRDASIAASWYASTDVRTEVTEPALTDLLAEIARAARQAGAREGAGGRQARDRRQLRAVAREPAAGAQLLRRQLAVRPAGRLLGHVSGAHQAVTAAAGAGGGAEVLGPARLQIVAVGDATKITDILEEEGHARDLRRRRQSR